MQKSDHKSLYEHIETAGYESHKTVLCNTIIAHRWYEDSSLNKSHKIKVSVLEAFVITKDKILSRYLQLLAFGLPITLLIAVIFL